MLLFLLQLPFDLPNQSGRSVRQAATLPFPDILSGLLPSNLSGDSLRLLVCNNTGVLDQLVTFGDGVSANEVAGEVCALNDSQLQGLSDELQDQLNTVRKYEFCVYTPITPYWKVIRS